MDFTGFEPHDFEQFSIPDFAGRMAAIRALLRPKLVTLGADLGPAIQSLTGLPAGAHVAQHMRRRVNPPQETWVAFGRDRKGYKRWVHYRVAVSGEGVRVTVFIEDDADDKAPFGARLAAEAEQLLASVRPAGDLRWYTLPDGGTVDAAALRAAGQQLQRVKGLKFQAGVPLPAAAALRISPHQFEDWALQQVERLRPLYLAAVSPSA